MTRRGKLMLTVIAAVVVVVGAVVIIPAFGDPPPVNDPSRPVATDAEGSPILDPGCPLTGVPPEGGEVPDRPALAIKVENSPEARPQYGLDDADIVYEEPVEGGITRFIAIYQCTDARRVEPVRSARTSDPPFLIQFGEPLFAYADAAEYVQKDVERYPQIQDVNWQKVPDAYHEDGAREAPHHLYTSTKELWEEAKKTAGVPMPVFEYGEMPEGVKTKRAKKVNLTFSSTYADVWWKYGGGTWQRSHGSEPHLLAGQDQVTADNVLVQVVKLENTGRKDPANNAVYEVEPLGSGKAYLFRDGQVLAGKWTREVLKDTTSFTTRSGQEFVLKAGNTWIELYPSSAPKVRV